MLTAKELLARSNAPGRHSVDRNLELVVKRRGKDGSGKDPDEITRRSWIFRYSADGHKYQREMGLGAFRDLSLADARKAADDHRARMAKARALRETYDPIAEDEAKMAAAKLEGAKRITFGECADAYLATRQWKDEKARPYWTSMVSTYLADLRPMAVSAIAEEDLIKCFMQRTDKLVEGKKIEGPFWHIKAETASKLRQLTERIFGWAIVRKFRTTENPARWRAHLQTQLASPAKLKKVVHRPAVPYAEIADFMEKLRAREGLAAKALEFQILTAARPGEACGAKWDEIDLKTRTWTIPATRMKAAHEHRVPLSDDAVKLLEGLERVDEFTFPGGKEGTALTTAAGMKLMKALYRGKMAHGFRSTFRDWAAECTKYQREVIEHALAHRLKDKAEAAYFRSDVFLKRTRLMQDWAKACRTKPVAIGDKVVEIRKKRA